MAIEAQLPSLGSQDWMIMDGGGCGGGVNSFYFNLQQHQQLLEHQQQQQQQKLFNMQEQNLCCPNNNVVVPLTYGHNMNNWPPMSFCQKMAVLDAKQRQEIDQYIRLQDEKLRLLLQEQRRQQVALLMKNVESKALPLLRQKEMEMAQARKRERELQDFLKKLEGENQEWQRLAQENEAMVISLNKTIQQVREKAASCVNYDNRNNYDTNGGSGAEDAESCCDNQGKTEQENRGFGIFDCSKEREVNSIMCRACKCRNSCVLFLPCRHLSSCNACEALLHSCPLCFAPKKAIIEALMC